MMKRLTYIALILLAALAVSCKKPFAPEITSTNNSYLVVEGVINTGNDSTQIKLSRTVKLSDSTRSMPEMLATVYVEDDKNARYNLIEVLSGLYQCAPLNFKNVQKCRLHIITADKKEYVSDYTQPAITPPIDSLNVTVLTTGIQFSVSTHDPSNLVKYFRYDYDETWEYNSLIQTNLKYENDQIKFRTDTSEQIYRCWHTDHAYQILLANAGDLTQSVINIQPILYVDRATGKLPHGYSVLLHQYALSKDAYNYYQNLKKNTEQLGSIFDAQPSDLTGNLHNVTDAKEPVIGYITASNSTSKRKLFDPYYLNIAQFNNDYYPPPLRAECDTPGIFIEPMESFAVRAHNKFFKGDSLLVQVIERKPDGKLLGYGYAQANCVDCRLKLKGSTNKRPLYWPSYL